MTNTYTIYAQWPDGSIEEVDVQAFNASDAEANGEEVLTEDYKPGWQIIRIEERADGYFYF